VDAIQQNAFTEAVSDTVSYSQSVNQAFAATEYWGSPQIGNSNETACSSPCSSLSIEMSTAHVPDLIIVEAETTNTQAATCTGIPSTPTVSSLTSTGLAFILRQSANGPAGLAGGTCYEPHIEYWYAQSDVLLTKKAFSVVLTGKASDFTIIMWGIYSYNTAAPFDPDAGADCTNEGYGASPYSCDITTSFPHDLLLGGFEEGATGYAVYTGFIPVSSSPSLSSNYTRLLPNPPVEWATVSSAKTYHMGWNSPSSAAWVLWGDAVQGQQYSSSANLAAGISLAKTLTYLQSIQLALGITSALTLYYTQFIAQCILGTPTPALCPSVSGASAKALFDTFLIVGIVVGFMVIAAAVRKK
jgi:hypothetical protein